MCHHPEYWSLRAVSYTHLRKLAQYLSVYKWSILIVVIFAIASTIFAIVGPKILGKATTKLFEGVMNMVRGTGEGIDFAYIAQILLFLLGIYAISSLFSYIQGYIMTGVSMKVTYNMRKEMCIRDSAPAVSVQDSRTGEHRV